MFKLHFSSRFKDHVLRFVLIVVITALSTCAAFVIVPDLISGLRAQPASTSESQSADSQSEPQSEEPVESHPLTQIKFDALVIPEPSINASNADYCNTPIEAPDPVVPSLLLGNSSANGAAVSPIPDTFDDVDVCYGISGYKLRSAHLECVNFGSDEFQPVRPAVYEKDPDTYDASQKVPYHIEFIIGSGDDYFRLDTTIDGTAAIGTKLTLIYPNISAYITRDVGCDIILGEDGIDMAVIYHEMVEHVSYTILAVD